MFIFVVECVDFLCGSYFCYVFRLKGNFSCFFRGCDSCIYCFVCMDFFYDSFCINMG